VLVELQVREGVLDLGVLFGGLDMRGLFIVGRGHVEGLVDELWRDVDR
jgi:hypothetical protein